MGVSAAQRVGKTLARIGHLRSLQGERPQQGMPEKASRQRILNYLSEQDEAAKVEEICKGTGLHANTVRGHLEVLVASGDVTRRRGSSSGRGRPPWLYLASEQAQAGTLTALERALREQLELAHEEDITEGAAQRWSQIETTNLRTDANTPDEAVDVAVSTLERAGFEASAGWSGDRIELRACPYADLVADQPVICDIHASLLSHVLNETEQPVSVRALDVWVQPGVCVAHLDRPDRTPSRRIEHTAADLAETVPEPEAAETKKDR